MKDKTWNTIVALLLDIGDEYTEQLCAMMTHKLASNHNVWNPYVIKNLTKQHNNMFLAYRIIYRI
jgi:hypothetical protein